MFTLRLQTYTYFLFLIQFQFYLVKFRAQGGGSNPPLTYNLGQHHSYKTGHFIPFSGRFLKCLSSIASWISVYTKIVVVYGKLYMCLPSDWHMKMKIVQIYQVINYVIVLILSLVLFCVLKTISRGICSFSLHKIFRRNVFMLCFVACCVVSPSNEKREIILLY